MLDWTPPTIKLFLFLLPNCNLATVRNHNLNNCFSYGLSRILWKSHLILKGVETHRIKTIGTEWFWTKPQPEILNKERLCKPPKLLGEPTVEAETTVGPTGQSASGLQWKAEPWLRCCIQRTLSCHSYLTKCCTYIYRSLLWLYFQTWESESGELPWIQG